MAAYDEAWLGGHHLTRANDARLARQALDALNPNPWKWRAGVVVYDHFIKLDIDS
jgi:hypothetical protein